MLFAVRDSNERQALLNAHRLSVLASLDAFPVVAFKMEEHLTARNGAQMVHTHLNVTGKGIDMIPKRLEADRIYNQHLNDSLDALGYVFERVVKS